MHRDVGVSALVGIRAAAQSRQQQRDRLAGKRVGGILSGGNVDLGA
jgi:hypothetical protein